MNDQNYEVFEAPDGLIKSWTKGVPLEDEALAQLGNCAGLPFIHKHIAVMPDAHWGKGSTVGSVIPTKGAIIPAAVGVDIGCGMMAVETGLSADDLPDNLAGVRSAIEAAVPHGRTNNGKTGDRGAWGETPARVYNRWHTGSDSNSLGSLYNRHNLIVEKHPKAKAFNTHNQLGTLGSGNHFIEICLDEVDNVWAMLHSGSRGLGNKIGMYFIEQAKKDMKRWFINLPDENLAYIPEGSELFNDYIEALNMAQDFARVNREIMMKATLGALQDALGKSTAAISTAVNCHHNYVEKENHFGSNIWITRKGAVRARKGDLGIIPGSMGTKSFIVRGLGNADSFHSCSHGAGRVMSRTRARKEFTLEDHAKATEGVECKKDASVLDETPGAYKSIDAVMAAQTDLVEVVHTLKQVVCVKG